MPVVLCEKKEGKKGRKGETEWSQKDKHFKIHDKISFAQIVRF